MSLKSTFRSLKHTNYRMWAGGAIVSNVGTWMQRTAQDWIVLTQLTDKNATAIGIVIGLQFGPQVLLLPVTGFAADHLDRRKLLIATQAAMGLLALGLGILTVGGWVQLWHVYLFALLLGCVTAFDAPARQTFVADLVGENDLSNAVALNSTSFNLGRTIGPAIAGVLIAAVGCGWVFLINGVSYIAVIASLYLLKRDQLTPVDRAMRNRGRLTDGFRYVWKRPGLRTLLLMLFLIGTFGLKFPIYISTMTVTVFHADADHYGLLTSLAAVGSVAGALLSASTARPRLGAILIAAGVFGLAFVLAALMPGFWMFGLMLVLIGLSAQMFTTTTNSAVQLSTDPAMRGRVIAILMAIFLGGSPIGGPIVGWVADRYGARWALLVGAASALAAVLVGLRYMVRYRGLRIEMQGVLPRLRYDEAPAPAGPTSPPSPNTHSPTQND
ncbi:MFS transporter [Ruficoccus sp. ZRK36]|uniref:MFS transporter n=1 Tax=Ruficoccus sp. ZRK36 TaxID=2866311 RepID=UPI001C732387|nr:MFS transporter [Ruficoccus sp. ZRK36]QYY36965.1 MFS transporter [Ruficoccus sp. ZRK36]